VYRRVELELHEHGVPQTTLPAGEAASPPTPQVGQSSANPTHTVSAGLLQLSDLAARAAHTSPFCVCLVPV
jgi:hypothetical protein